MRKIFALSFLIVLAIGACTNHSATNDKQDSIEAAAAADSMLRDATQNDTTSVDKVAVDTVVTDSL